MKLPKFDIRYIYVMYSYSLWYRFKCGISGNVQARRAQLEKELSAAMNRQVKVRVAMSVPSLFSESQETKIHGWLKRIGLHDKGMVYHSGYSEWFWFINPIGAILLYYALKYAGANVSPCHIALFMLLPVFPLDAALLVFVVFAVEILLFIASVILLFYGCSNIINYLT